MTMNKVILSLGILLLFISCGSEDESFELILLDNLGMVRFEYEETES